MTQVEAEPKIRIMVALANAEKPLQASEIASEAGISRQLLGYWLPDLIANGLVLPVQTFRVRKYVIQPVLIEYELTPKRLRDMMDPLVGDADLSHVKDRDDAILNIVHMTLLLYGELYEEEDEDDEDEKDESKTTS